MPTIFTHAAVPLAAAFALGAQRVTVPLAVTGAVLAILPDADVVGFKFGIAYADDWGHRGATHAIVFAALVASVPVLAWQSFRALHAWFFLFLAAASHGLLDMLTDGGLGVALFWPVDTARHFFAVTPIRVSPIGANFISARGIETMLSELVWIWLPLTAFALGARMLRR